ncbi:MAG: hypothetical protein WD225_08905 [Ilumatobacteraceae bacterium]
MTPRHRPPVGLRVFIAFLGIGAVGFNAALMLSDRAPGALRQIGGGIVVRLSERIDAGGRPARLTSDPRLPSGDTLVHIGVWGTAMLFVGLAVWSWRGLAVGAAGVLICSLAVEVGQRRYTVSRTFQMSDIVANTVGVAAGAAAAAGCYLLWSGVAQLLGARRPADTG